MICLPATFRVFVATAPVNLRKSYDGLAQVARNALGQDPLSGHLLVFSNRRRDRIKILYWDRDGFALWMKKLEAGCARPRPCTENRGPTHNLAGRPVTAGGMGSSPARRRARRRSMPRDTTGVAPPRARRSPRRRRSTISGAD